MNKTIISKQYFNQEIKQYIALLQLNNFIDVSIIEEASIKKEEFIKDSFILSPNTQLDKMLQEITQKFVIQIQNNIEKFIVKDIDNKNIMTQLPYDHTESYLASIEIQKYEEEMFNFLDKLDSTTIIPGSIVSCLLSPKIPLILCDNMSYQYFAKNRFFKRKFYRNTYGEMLNRQYIYLPELDKIKTKYKDILQKQVLKMEEPSILIASIYNTEHVHPIELVITLPKKIDENCEYYYKLSWTESDTVEADKDSLSNGLAPLFKPAKRPNSQIVPILTGLHRNMSHW